MNNSGDSRLWRNCNASDGNVGEMHVREENGRFGTPLCLREPGTAPHELQRGIQAIELCKLNHHDM